MKTKLTLPLLCFCLLHSAFCLSLHAQGSSLNSFTYQGRLQDTNGPANGLYDFSFTLFPASTGGSPIGTSVARLLLPVTNGLFTVPLEFLDANSFSGADRWLEIAVHPSGVGTNLTLSPRQQITAAPYAIRAANLSGALPLSQLPAGVVTNNGSGVTLTGTFTGDGVGLSNVNATTLGGLSSAGFWKTNGNAGANPANGAFLGTTDNLPLEFRVNGARALRLEPNTNGAPNVIGGSPSNSVAASVEGATIAGGGLGLYPNSISASYATIGGGTFNTAAGGWATIGGGRDINVAGNYSTVSGGSLNTIQANADFATIGGGANNTVSSNAVRGTVGGGFVNTVGAPEGTVAGGAFNSALGFSSTIGGGGGNAVSGAWSIIAGGRDNLLTNADYAAIGGGVQNSIQTNAPYSTIGGGALNVVQSNAYRGTVSGGWVNTVGLPEGTVAGGAFNSALGFSSTIGGGGGNTASGAWSTIAGGRDNQLADGLYGTIGGGVANAISNGAAFATISGGQFNQATASESAVAGGAFNSALGLSSAIGGGSSNAASGTWSTIGGGRDNLLTNANYATIGGGRSNQVADSRYATIGGGIQNTIQTNALVATIGGGYLNTIHRDNFYATIGGGLQNTIQTNATVTTIAGGSQNMIQSNARYATIGGGAFNQIQPNADFATIPGGQANSATNFAFAAGLRAKANHTGAFVWADSSDADFLSTRTNQFNIRAGGGVRLETGGAGMTLDGVNVLSGIVPSASLAGTYGNAVTLNNAANSFAGNGASLTALNASQLASGTVPATALGNAWRLGGNAGTAPGTQFLGTTDNQPLEFKVNGARVLRLEPNTNGAPNVIGGSPSNGVAALVEGATIAGGGLGLFPNKITASYATIAGGTSNNASGGWAAIGGGRDNIASGAESSVPGGRLNTASGQYSTAMGGQTTASGLAATALGRFTRAINDDATAMGLGSIASGWDSLAMGTYTVAGGHYSVSAGYYAQANHQGSFVWADSTSVTPFASTANNQFLLRASGGVGIGTATPGSSLEVAGGLRARGGAPGAAGGNNNGYAFSGNGGDNDSGMFSSADGQVEFYGNSVERMRIASTGNVGIGTGNPQASLHVYSANNPTVMRLQSAGGFGAGRVEFLSDPQGSGNEWRPGFIQSTDNGGFTGGLSFVVNGSGGGNLFTEVETMRIVNGRVGIGTTTPVSALQVVGTVTATAFNPPSDRNLKENFAPVNPREVLDKVTALPISRWNFKGDDATPHVGPMAQDFHAAFGLGTDERHIATVDADGVALAAIQGLNQKVDEEVATLRSENTELKQELAELKQMLMKLATKGN